MAYETAEAVAMQGETLRKGSWHEEEDERLINFVKLLGSRRWDYVARVSGLKRSGKSCRLRWLNYLRPNIKRGHITAEEEKIILQLHQQWGNKWSMIARRLPGRTDNEIKNYWRTHLRKKILIPQQENFQFERDNVDKQLFLFQEDGSSAQSYNTGKSYKPCENINFETENSSHDNSVVLSDYSLATSPYQTRLSDWISEFSSESKSQQESNSTGSCYCYPEWISEENDLWGSLGTLWNME